MKTRSLSFFLCFFTLLYSTSCKKTDVKEPETPVLSSKDPQAVSAAVKVWHGERLQGNAPAPRGSGLELNASMPITHAFAGRYAIIEPVIMQGDVAGYYLQINGSKEHFKIDYSKPRGGRVGTQNKKSRFVTQGGRVQNGNADSAIVIALPASLQVPDTLCVSFCAYDAQGNISNVISTCIVVNSLGADAAGSFLNGSWRQTAYWDSASTAHDTVIYNKWVAPLYHPGYICDPNPNTGNNMLTYNFNNSTSVVSDSTFYEKWNFTFGSNGGMAYAYQEKWKSVDMTASTCSQYVFNPIEDYADNFTGAWNYNSTTGKMVLVLEFDDAGIPSLEAWEFDVVKISNNHILLVDNLILGYPSYFRLEK